MLKEILVPQSSTCFGILFYFKIIFKLNEFGHFKFFFGRKLSINNKNTVVP